MRMNSLKAAAFAAVAGTILQLGTCLSVNQWPQAGASGIAFDQVLTQDVVFDPFEGGAAGG